VKLLTNSWSASRDASTRRGGLRGPSGPMGPEARPNQFAPWLIPCANFLDLADRAGSGKSDASRSGNAASTIGPTSRPSSRSGSPVIPLTRLSQERARRRPLPIPAAAYSLKMASGRAGAYSQPS
jgi:hypothetical protein